MKKNVLKKAAGAVAVIALLAVFSSCKHDAGKPPKSDPAIDPITDPTGEDDEDTVDAGWIGSITGGEFWTVFASENDVKVEPGKTVTTTMTMTANGGLNFTLAPDVILRNAEKTEYGVMRLDHYGWLYGNNTVYHNNILGWNLESDWNWETIVAELTGATVKISVTNTGDGKAVVRYDVTTTENTTHFQKFSNVSVDADDLYMQLVFENCSATFADAE